MSVPDSIVFASSNPHKLEEVSHVFAGINVSVEGLDAFGEFPEPVEDGRTFTANALIKARHYAAATGRLVLADDSGLSVDALGGAPGVISARYAGVTDRPRPQIDAANNARLVEQLRHVPEAERTARFVCVMALCDAKMTWAIVRGSVEGRIVLEPRGDNGFGYDPHVEIATLGRTAAELPPDEKNAISHRGNACRRMIDLAMW